MSTGRFISTPHFHLSVIVLFSSIILFANLKKGDLGSYDEPLYAHEAKQMLVTGDWWSIRFNGALNFEYPPMFIWLEALSMKALGITDAAAKFPAALAGLLTIILVFFIARELSEEFWVPICAALVLMLSQYYMKYAMRAMTDTPFTLFFTLALFLYLKGLKRPHCLIFCGLATGCAILTRSVLGLIPLGIILAHLIINRKRERYRLSYLLIGFLLAILMPAIWYVSQYRLHGERFIAAHYNFISGKISAQQEFDVGLFLRGLLKYPKFLLKLYMPWFPLMIAGLVIQIKRMLRARDRLAEVTVVWVALVVIPFSLVEAKVLRYIIPAFPVFSLLAAIPLAGSLARVRKEIYLQAGYLALFILVVLIAAFPRPLARAAEMKRLGPVADSYTRPNQRVTIYITGDAYRDYLVNEFLWYSNRFCTEAEDSARLMEGLRESESRTFIVDKGSYERLIASSGIEVEVLMRTENFVCFRTVGEIGYDRI